jgi:hypothetical protein
MLPGTIHQLNAGGTSNVLLPANATGNDSYTISLLHFDAPQASIGAAGAGLVDSAYAAPSRKNAWSVVAGSPRTLASYPFNQVMYFPANGYIQCPHAPDLIPQGDFTIDFNACFSGSQTAGLISKPMPSGYSPYTFNVNATNLTLYMSSNGTSWDLVNGAILANGFSPGIWYHFAVTRQGPTIRTFINGSLIQTIATGYSGPLFNSTGTLQIGGTSGFYFNGYLDEFRISSMCRWTAAFTPQNQPYYGNLSGGGNDAATKLLLHLNNNVTDSAKGTLETSRVVTNNGAAFAGTPGATAIGANVLYITGNTGQRLTIPHNEELNAFRGNFTLECFYFRTANGGIGDIIAKREGITYSPYLIYEGGSGNVGFLISTAGTTWDINYTVSPALALSTWYHLAMVRNGSDLGFYVDGVRKFGQNIGLGGLYEASGGMNIGGLAGTSPFAYIDEVRFSDVARWTGAFTRPAVPYS